MKNSITILFLIAVLPIYSQNRYTELSTSSYTPRSLSEIMAVPNALQGRYNENQKFLYGLKKWILELKTEIKEEPFLGRLIGEYELLTSMEDDDLARATKKLNQREIEINEIITEYKQFVSEKKKNENASITYSKNNHNIKSLQVKSTLDEGVSDYSNKNFPSAIVKLTKHLNDKPNDTNALFYRALAKGEVNDYYGAISDYDKIISLGGSLEKEVYKFSTVYNNKAYLLVKLGKYKEALPIVGIALNLDESEYYIWDTRAEIFLNLGQLDKCIADCNKAIGIEPNGNSYYVRGLARIKKGEKTKGCQDLSKAGELGETRAYEKINVICNKE